MKRYSKPVLKVWGGVAEITKDDAVLIVDSTRVIQLSRGIILSATE